MSGTEGIYAEKRAGQVKSGNVAGTLDKFPVSGVRYDKNRIKLQKGCDEDSSIISNVKESRGW